MECALVNLLLWEGGEAMHVVAAEQRLAPIQQIGKGA